MIFETTFSASHIDSISLKYKIDKQLVQKQVAALALLSHLSHNGLQFIFKGGTSLLCLLTPPTRLSLDIDITVAPDTEIMNTIEIISRLGPFKRFEEDKRNSVHQIPKSHFKFFFDSFIVRDKEEYILLDVLYEENLYPSTQQSIIPSDFLLTEHEVSVTTPTIDSILGDKLTAYAPNTTGIPYERGSVSMNMEIIKQLFDISNLFDYCSGVDMIAESFYRICGKEIIYRQQEGVAVEDVLDDIFNTSIILLERNEKDLKFSELLTGVNRLKSYIIQKGFHLDYAIIAAGKAAYLSRLIKFRAKTAEKYIDFSSVDGLEFKKPEYIRFNKLRRTNPQAFFYWYKALDLK